MSDGTDTSELSFHESFPSSPSSPDPGHPSAPAPSYSFQTRKKKALNAVVAPPVVPNLVNPFHRKPLAGYGEGDAGLVEDLDQLRKCLHTSSGSPDDPMALSNEARSRGVSHSLVKVASRNGNASPSKQPFESQDNCSACLGSGRLLCCDTCPRVFHFFCVAEGFGETNEPEGSWQCRSCVSQQHRGPSAGAEEDEEKEGEVRPAPAGPLFEELVRRMDGMNPRSFQLPISIRDQYQHVIAHPISGEYIDTREQEVSRASNQAASTRITRKKALAAPPNLSSSIDIPVPAPSVSNSAKPSQSSTLQLPICYKCSKTEQLPIGLTPLLSYTFPQPKNGIQSLRSDLIKCDYCGIHWHLDCLDPPLACIPPQLRLNEHPPIDMYAHALLKQNIWGLEKHPYDEPLYNIPSVLGEKKLYSTRDVHLMCKAAPESGLFDQDRFIRIRPRWKCPLHADWSEPSHARVQWSESDKNYMDRLGGAPKKRSNRLPAPTSDSPLEVWQEYERLKKEGLIHVDLDPSSTAIFEPPSVPVKETKVLVEFMEKACPSDVSDYRQARISLREDLYAKFAEYGNQWSSARIDRLVEDTHPPPLGKFVRLVDRLVEEQSEVETNMQETAAAMLLFQLELQDRFIQKHIDTANLDLYTRNSE
ncbi:hypothetical protein HDV03_005427 [Kappamyces sp. JEL0829]|nr:hypothetical protein HDV03_005427 [Kappamyces sp. JEL0829]